MISEFFINLGIGFATWFVGLFPEWDVPAEVESFDSTVSGFIGPFANLSVWIPWALVLFCVVTAVGAWAIGWGVKSIRAIASHIPFLGGAG